MTLSSVGPFWTDFIRYSPLISSVILIITFIISQLIAQYSRKSELRRSWYFKAYFDSSLEKIDEFFKSCDTIIKKSLKKVSTLESEEEKQTYVTKQLEKISDTQRKFQMEVLYPLKGAYPETFKHLDLILESFYDIHSKVFDSDRDSEAIRNAYISEIINIKSRLMAFLAIPVSKSKQSRRLIREIEKQNPLREETNYGKIFIWFIVATILFFVIFTYCQIFKPDESISEKKEKALSCAQQYISKKLVSPSTADFDYNYQEGVKQVGLNLYYIESFVDSQNIYGASIRTYFTSVVEFDSLANRYICKKTSIKNN